MGERREGGSPDTPRAGRRSRRVHPVAYRAREQALNVNIGWCGARQRSRAYGRVGLGVHGGRGSDVWARQRSRASRLEFGV